jgi:predicted Zn-dependent peptidase
MTAQLDKYILPNGLVVLGEPMETAESAAFCFMLPAGASTLPDGCSGAGNIIADWIFRGAGGRSSRDLVDTLDGLGLHRHNGVGSSHITLAGVLQADNLHAAIELYADIIQQPALELGQFEFSRQLALQELQSLDDDPRQKVMLKLCEQFYPQPLGRSPLGTTDDLQAITPEKCAQLIKHKFSLSQSIFAVAGKYDFEVLCRQMEKLFAVQQQTPTTTAPPPGKRGVPYLHEPYDGAQVHIGLMTQTVTVTSPDYYNAMAAVSVLSGGMSARLFTEVREKRGLCYAIGARYHTLKQTAGIACYAGTTPNKAQETLQVITKQFRQLAEGISQEEINRAKVGLKSALILQSESSSSRAGGIAGDYYLLGRVRSLEEIKHRIEQINVDCVVAFLRTNQFKEFTVVSIGPKQLVVGN